MEAFEISSQGRDLESCGGLSWEDLLEKPEALSDFEPDTRAQVLMCLFPLLLWSLSFVMVSLVVRIGILWNRSPFLLRRRVCLDSHAGRDEIRRFTSDSAPATEKKNDAHTTAKFVFIICRESRSIARWTTRLGGRVRKRRGVKNRLRHRMKDSGKWAWKTTTCCVELIGKKGDGGSGR